MQLPNIAIIIMVFVPMIFLWFSYEFPMKNILRWIRLISNNENYDCWSIGDPRGQTFVAIYVFFDQIRVDAAIGKP